MAVSFMTRINEKRPNVPVSNIADRKAYDEVVCFSNPASPVHED